MTSRHGHRGQGLVEFALIVPVFLFLLLFAVDFGRLLFTYIQLSNSARETAAYAAFNPTTATAQLTSIASREANIQGQGGQGTIAATSACATSAGATIACSAAQGGGGAGNRITVSVNETFRFFTPLINNFWGGGGLPVSSSATAAVTVFAAGGGGAPSTCTTLPATPVFTWQSPNPVLQPLLISVDAGTSPNLGSPCQNVGYNWDFGGSSSDSPANPEDPFREGLTQDYEFLLPGTYTVTLVVSNAAGDSVPVTKTISLGTSPCNPPTANFTVSPSVGLTYYKNSNFPGTAITFDGNSSAYMSDPACNPIWSWDLGDTSALKTTAIVAGYHYNQNPSIWNNGTHTVTVMLTVRNDAGTDTESVNLTMDRN